MNKLKRCPFCGGSASIVQVTRHIENNLIVAKCDLCGAATKCFNEKYEEKAVMAWNQRKRRSRNEEI